MKIFSKSPLFRNRVWQFVLAGASLATSQIALAEPEGTEPSFALKVRPILSDKCFLCHGPDEGTREAELRMDTAAGIEVAFADGDFNSSEAWRRIISDDPDEQMPPPETGRRVSAAEKATLRKWMEGGAKWSGHWAFQPPQASTPPPSSDWGVGPIDAFVASKLNSAAKQPAPRASKDILLRRLSFDLTGLPPTIDELDAFLNDNSANAYERAVDRLLASPHYGERVAAVWLDAARYSDTFGYQRDEDRFVWPWRDWVVRALNDNMPYDEFMRQQLAGDLIDDATDDTILATTFSRLHGQNSEGGSIEEEFRAEYIADRTQTFGAAMLGLTMECCKCHDHKYDPLSQKDFYALSAFFDKIDEAGLKSYFTKSTPTPTLRLIDDEQRHLLQEKQSAVEQARQELDDIVKAERSKWLTRVGSWSTKAVELPKALKTVSFDNQVAKPNRTVSGIDGQAVELTGDDEIKLAEGFAFDRADSFSFSLWVHPSKHHERAVVFHRSRAWLDSGSRGYELIIEDGRLSAAMVHFWPGNAIRVRAKQPLAMKTWSHVAITYDGSSRAAGLRLFIDGRLAEVDIVRDGLTKTAVSENVKEVAIGARFRDRGFSQGAIDELQIYERQLSAAEVATIFDAASHRNAAPSLSAEQHFEQYLLTESSSYLQAKEQLQSLRQELFDLENSFREIMVMRDYAGARTSHIRIRGAYDQLGDPVEPDVPEVLQALAIKQGANRLTLANWLAEPENPLSSRVAVNRFWQMIFGAGLVRTPEDFGAQGEPPTHPELLDFLATEFVSSDWDLKALIKRMVMSETYRQSSSVNIRAFDADPENRLLGRATRRRWPAEMLRDNVLKASGLLAEKIGGSPVKPYEIEASFAPSPRDKGEGLYRRSLYTYFKRSAPAPVMSTFDTPDRSVCRVKREQTKSPLQALVLLNGPQFVEAARILAEEALSTRTDSDESIIDFLFRSLTSQKPTDGERTVLVDLLKNQRQRFSQAPENANRLLGVGERKANTNLNQAELAATTIVAQTIMSCDKCVTRQ